MKSEDNKKKKKLRKQMKYASTAKAVSRQQQMVQTTHTRQRMDERINAAAEFTCVRAIALAPCLSNLGTLCMTFRAVVYRFG